MKALLGPSDGITDSGLLLGPSYELSDPLWALLGLSQSGWVRVTRCLWALPVGSG